jgi:hypothetical protein
MISFLDYQRIFRAIYSTLDGTKSANHNVACLFYGVGGAYILNKSLGSKARPAVGMAVYRVLERDEGQNTIAYCEPVTQPDGTQVARASERGWHCWVECEGVFYDFMAPVFKEIGAAQGIEVPRRMFAKPYSAMAKNLDALKKPGDFLLAADPDMERDRLESFTDNGSYTDLIEIARNWFAPNPKKMKRHIEIMDTKYGKVRWPLTDISIEGAW